VTPNLLFRVASLPFCCSHIIKKKGPIMAKNEQTGRPAGKSASKVLRGTGTAKDAKRAAGCALTQRPDRRKKK
jgi:hypothetical protein